MRLVVTTIIWSNSLFFFVDTRTHAACWTALWHLGVLCYEGCGTRVIAWDTGYRRREWNWPKEARNRQTWVRIASIALSFLVLFLICFFSPGL